MRIGILADIHEDVGRLRSALDVIRGHGVDRLVVLGDVIETGDQLADVAGLLAAAGAVGVWGNHDLGLCCDPDPDVLARYAGPGLDYLRTLCPRLEAGGCLFTHGLPCWDPADPVAYYTGDRPETDAGRAAAFAASASGVSFVGHFHRWLATTPSGPVDWAGDRPLRLSPPDRWLVVVAAVCDGWCAVYDTDTHWLTPLRLAEPVDG